MAYDIKSFKPRFGAIKQGYFKPLNPDKYVGDVTSIIYRSSWELKFLKFCDTNANVIRYSSEAVCVPYINLIDKKTHKYFVDFYAEFDNGDGGISKWLIEVKPMKFVAPPVRPRRETQKSLERYIKAMKRHMVNHMKYEAARNFAAAYGMTFGIVTENFVFRRTNGTSFSLSS